VFSSKSKNTQAGSINIGMYAWFIYLYYNSHAKRGCVTPKVLANVNNFIDGDVTMLDGFEELPDAEQSKVRKALEDGHVDDEDWKGVSGVVIRVLNSRTTLALQSLRVLTSARMSRRIDWERLASA
jgi:hypothetical protein